MELSYGKILTLLFKKMRDLGDEREVLDDKEL